jgi:hypothetical protein
MKSLSAGMLDVRYSKLPDRLSHTIGFQIGFSYMPLLESIEGSQEEPWPTSPPMQQVVEECFTPSKAPVLLGVGLSGNGHWSMAVETPDSDRLKFDVACKNSKNAVWLGSQYRICEPPIELVKPKPLIPSVPRQSLETGGWHFDVANWGDVRIELRVSIGQLEYLHSERLLRVLPNSTPSEIRTHRWCYEIGIFEGR